MKVVQKNGVISFHGKGGLYRLISFPVCLPCQHLDSFQWGPNPTYPGQTQQKRSPKACVTLSLVTSRIIRSPAQVFLPDGNSFLNSSDPLCDLQIFTLRSSLKQGGILLGIELYLISYYFEI